MFYGIFRSICKIVFKTLAYLELITFNPQYNFNKAIEVTKHVNVIFVSSLGPISAQKTLGPVS